MATTKKYIPNPLSKEKIESILEPSMSILESKVYCEL